MTTAKENMKANKDKRTISALASIMGCNQIGGDLPPLGEKGRATALVQRWAYDGESVIVVEDIILRYERLPSGRVGRWKMDAVDCDPSSPHYGEKTLTEGKGQFDRGNLVKEDYVF
jgi:hypothetical protein